MSDSCLEKGIVQIYFADGSSKSMALPIDATVNDVFQRISSQSHYSLVSLAKSNEDISKEEQTDWRMLVVRPLKREGATFTLPELNCSDVARVMDPKEKVFAEIASWKLSSSSATAVGTPKLLLVNSVFTIRISFRNIPEVPDNYMRSFYVTPTMTAESITEMIVQELSLRPGSLRTAPDDKQRSSSWIKYSLNEVREYSNHQVESRKLSENDMPFQLRTKARPYLSDRTMVDHFFQLYAPVSWLNRLKTKMAVPTSLGMAAAAESDDIGYQSNGGSIPSQSISSPVSIRKQEVMKTFGDNGDDGQKAYTYLLNIPNRDFDRMFDRLLDELNIKNADTRKQMTCYEKERKATLLMQNYMHQARHQAQRTANPLTVGTGSRLAGQPGTLMSQTSKSLRDAETSDATEKEKTGGILAGLLGKKETGEKTPGFYIEKLNNTTQPKMLLKLLIALRVSLSTAKISWIREFLAAGKGVIAISGVLDRVLIRRRDPKGGVNSDMDEDIRGECLKCLRVLLNTEPGFVTVLSSQLIVSKIAFCLHTSNDKLRTTVAEILAALIVLSGDVGYRMVLNAMSDFKGFYNERHRFEYLVNSLIGEDPLGTKGTHFSDSKNPVVAFDYKTTAMSLINAIVTAPDSLEIRIQLRDELFQRGLTHDKLSALRTNAPISFLTQIDLYEDEMKEDLNEAELIVKEKGGLNVADPSQLFSQICSTVEKNRVTRASFISILQSLFLLVSSKTKLPPSSQACWQMVERFSQRAVDLDITSSGVKPSVFASFVRDFLDSVKDIISVPGSSADVVADVLRELGGVPNNHTVSTSSLSSIIDENDIANPLKIEQLIQTIENLKKQVAEKDSSEKLLRKELALIQKRTAQNVDAETSRIEVEELQKALTDSQIRESGLVRQLTDAGLVPNGESVSTDNTAALQNTISHLQENIDSLQQKLESLDETHVHELEEVAERYEAEITRYETELRKLRAQVSEADAATKSEGEIKELQENLELIKLDHSKELSEMEIRYQAEIARYESLVCNLQTKSLEIAPMHSEGSNSALDQSSLPPPPPPLTGQTVPSVPPSISLPPPPPPIPETTASGAVIPPPPPPAPGLSESGLAIAPPPPPPPPSLSASGIAVAPGGIPAPPPPPGALSKPVSNLPPKKKLKPNVPMKQLFWNKVPVANVENTIWKGLDEHQELKEIRTSELEEMFGKNSSSKTASNTSLEGDAGGSTKSLSSKKTTTIIDLNRANNIGIMLARIKLSYKEIKTAILSLDDRALSLDQVKALKQFVPTDEDIEAIKEYVSVSGPKSVEQLGPAEQYLHEVMTIPRLSNRLQCWIFKRRFEAEINEVKPELHAIQSAIKEVKQSKKFVKLLKTVLAIGNYMNGGSFRGEAYGFQLDALLKIKDTRTTVGVDKPNDARVGVTTLLHYLIYISDQSKSSGGFVDYIDEMPNVDVAARVSFQALQSQVRALKAGLDQISSELKSLESASISNDRFGSTMKTFVDNASQSVVEVSNLLSKLEETSKDLISSYGEDPTAIKLEDFFGIFVNFAGAIRQSRKEIEDARKKAEQPVSPLNQRKATGAAESKSNMPAIEKGDLENAIRQLKQGAGLRKVRRGEEKGPVDSGTSLDTAIGSRGRKRSNADDFAATEAIIRLQQQRMNLEKK